MKITFSELAIPKSGALAVGITKGGTLAGLAGRLDKTARGALSRALAASRFKGARGQTLQVLAPAGLGLSRIVIFGLGEPGELTQTTAQEVGGALMAAVMMSGEKSLAIAVEGARGIKLDAASRAAHIGFGALLRSYRFDKYKTQLKADKKPSLTRVSLLVKGAAKARATFRPLEKLAGGVFLTRDLVSEPGNALMPADFAEQARKLRSLGVKVEVLGEARMKKLGMNALLGVGQGSASPSFLVVLQWTGAPRKAGEKPLAFVGKGVTFDSGGISLKPGAGMADMKFDMGGAGAVIGLMKTLAGRKAKVNVVGVLGLVENMPSGEAQRPGDVVTSMSGQTIAVSNTDAEGRLVLADALWYTQKRFKPRLMIDLATLTGAILVALGHERAGIFANDDILADQLFKAGEASGDRVWRLPLDAAYDKLIDSPIADVNNIGGRNAGSITAAQFLQRFVNDTPWAHIDIAGTAWITKDTPTCPKGGTGFGVRLLDRLVADHFET